MVGVIYIYSDVWGRHWGSVYNLGQIWMEGENPLKTDPLRQHLKKKNTFPQTSKKGQRRVGETIQFGQLILLISFK